MALNIQRYISEALAWVVLWLGVFMLGGAVALAHEAWTR